MRKMWVVALREYRATVFTKAFLISLALMPILMGGSIVTQFLLKDWKSFRERKYAVIDRTPGGKVWEQLERSAKQRNDDAMDKETGKAKESRFLLERVEPSAWEDADVVRQRFDLSERVRKREIDGFLDIGPDVLSPPSATAALADWVASQFAGGRRDRDGDKAASRPQFTDKQVVRYYASSPLGDTFYNWAAGKLWLSVVSVRAREAKTSLGEVSAMIGSAVPRRMELARRNALTGELEDGKDANFLVSFLVPFGLIMLMYMIVMVGATPMMQGVVEEKMQRIAEVLLGSVSPFQLMLGKLIGGVGVSLTLAAVYLGGAYWGASQYGYLDYLTPRVVAWFLVYQVLGVLMFGAIFVAVGAACSDIKETQALLGPVMLLLVAPFFVLTSVIEEPDGAVATAASFFPPATPTLMVARLAIPPGVPEWQPYAGVAVVLATTLALVWAAGRIFRTGYLMQGKGAKFAEVFRWIWRG